MGSILVLAAIIAVIVFIFQQENKNNAHSAKTSKKKQAVKKVSTKHIDDTDEDAYSMFFDVVGESFKNDDGSSRQQIIKKYATEGEPAHLKFYNYKGNMACAVFVDEAQSKQIGHLPKSEVQEVYELVTSG